MILLFCLQSNSSGACMTTSFFLPFSLSFILLVPAPAQRTPIFFLFINLSCSLQYYPIYLSLVSIKSWQGGSLPSLVGALVSSISGFQGHPECWHPAGRGRKNEHRASCRKCLWARPRRGIYLVSSHFISADPKNRTRQNMPSSTK